MQTDTATQQYHDTRNPMLLSYSGIYSYLNCRHKWKLQNVFGMKTGLGTRPMEVGTAVHEALAKVLSFSGTLEDGINDWVRRSVALIPEDDEDGIGFSFADWEAQIQEYAVDALGIARRALDEIEARELQSVLDREGVPIVEREIIVPMEGWDGFAVHIDWIAFDPRTNTYWVVDFKTRGTFYDEASEEVNLQNGIYQYVGSTLGLEIAGSLTFQVRSGVPKVPKVNKDGTVSRAKIVTTWAVYESVLLEQKQDPAAYDDMKTYLDATEWTKVLTQYRSMTELENLWERIVLPLAYEMAQARDLVLDDRTRHRHLGMMKTPRTLTQRTCNGCPVRPICIAGIKGYDVLEISRGMKIREADAFETAAIQGLL